MVAGIADRGGSRYFAVGTQRSELLLSELARRAGMRILDSRWKGSHGIGRFATELHSRLDGFVEIALSGRPSRPADPWLLGEYLRGAAPELFLSPGFNAPAGSPCPFVFTIHDLNHLFVSDNSNALKKAYYKHVMRPAVHRARLVLTVSEFSRRAICEWAEVDEEKVVNVGNGVSAGFTWTGPAYRSEAPYFLYVGNHRPHKNFDRLLKAFARSGLAADFRLISTGAPPPSLRREIHRLRLAESVVFVGSVTDEELAMLYRSAEALVLVSLYEGFGLPLIEAMSCGTPVLASNAASIPEITGDAAVIVDPTDVEAIAAGMRALAHDSSLRALLRERGAARASLYTWDGTARKVREALQL